MEHLVVLVELLPEGVQKFFGGIGDFIKNNPVVGSIIKSIPGIANIPGLSNLFGLEEFPGMPGPIGVARTLAGHLVWVVYLMAYWVLLE